ncbi:MAG TPA: oligosaccharide flippase family protein, partial [Deinococcales bacterium]|nr:oligosaccharide flippase family protein [Deinococcales bacterium]
RDDAVGPASASRGVMVVSAALAGLALALGLAAAFLALDGNRVAGLTRTDLALVALATAITIVVGGFQAVLNGQKRLRDLAWLNSAAAFTGTAAAVAACVYSPANAVHAAFLFPLLASTVAVAVTARRLRWGPRLGAPRAGRALGVMLPTGLAVALGAVAATATQFAARQIIVLHGSLSLAGEFQAAFSISSVYLGVILSGLAGEYYPRISAIVEEPTEVARAVRGELVLVLLLSTPVIALMMAVGPALITLLYSAKFTAAFSVLAWQLVGDVFRVSGWVFATSLLAAGANRNYFGMELLWNALYIVALPLLWPAFGFVLTGALYAPCYVIYAGVGFFLVQRRFGRLLDARTGLVFLWCALAVLASYLSLSLSPWSFGLLVRLAVAAVSGAASAGLLFSQRTRTLFLPVAAGSWPPGLAGESAEGRRLRE